MIRRSYFTLILLSLGVFQFMQLVADDSWEGVWLPVAEANHEEGIPEEAIRLRILANSDSAQDQELKREVRDAVLKEMNTWVRRPSDLKEARNLVQSKLPVFEEIARKTVAEKGFHYPVKVKYGKVSFPTKLYGDHVYPAGEYEALRITIGEGRGGNWWCVLFPPLCFVDMSNGDAVSESEPTSLTSQTAVAEKAWASSPSPQPSDQEKPVEIRFWMLDSLMEFFSGLFR
ncbi:stage II sporulation protein R [Kroppenstedtia pulmonis]|uniref:Stage II sporulation protein R n=1 Tax=Kroppenstedtia pulmonis TaxID=1380685 RepID=A0A7D4BHB5_9BACL|nr:stage II sporulation protein R [Kroppenstedtia pulmonis]QKG85732.1 stage II sporulation protein R [Kroppenstedtia pulmonis]